MPFGVIRIMHGTYITRALVRAESRTLFVFGDNMARTGFGGQAKEMRGEPNALGIPTKWRPAKDNTAYFRDADFFMGGHVHREIHHAFTLIVAQLMSGGDVVLPEGGIGTGLADLSHRAPVIHLYIQDTLTLLTGIFNGKN
jgi:hypothetical protein